MRPSDFPTVLASARRADRFSKAVETVAGSVAAGRIRNVDFQDVKQVVNRAFEEAWTAHVMKPFFHDGRYEDRSDAEHDLKDRLGTPWCHTASGMLSKVRKARTDTEFVRATTALLEELAPLADAVVSLKDKVVKREAKEPEDRFAPYRVPVAGKEAIFAVKAALVEVTEDAYRELLAFYRRSFAEAVETYVKLMPVVARQREDGLVGKTVRDARGRAVLSTTPENDRREWLVKRYGLLFQNVLGRHGTRLPDTDAKTEAEADRSADLVREEFIYKNLEKLDSVIERKGDFLRIERTGYALNMGGLEGAFRLTFEDSASFDVRNSVVFVVNSHGTAFRRYPLTFHDVILGDGTRIKQPSEEKMNELFVTTPAEESGLFAP